MPAKMSIRAKTPIKVRVLALVVLLAAACNPMRGCVESEYDLAPHSRVPKWFGPLLEYDRKEIDIRVMFYAPFDATKDNAEIELRVRGAKRADASGRVFEHPRTVVHHYPRWTIVVVNGVVEVIEFRKIEPRFYITDDKSLVAEAAEVVKRAGIK